MCTSSDATSFAATGVADFGGPNVDCLLYTSDAADERSRVDLGGRRIIKKQNTVEHNEANCGDK